MLKLMEFIKHLFKNKKYHEFGDDHLEQKKNTYIERKASISYDFF